MSWSWFLETSMQASGWIYCLRCESEWKDKRWKLDTVSRTVTFPPCWCLKNKWLGKPTGVFSVCWTLNILCVFVLRRLVRCFCENHHKFSCFLMYLERIYEGRHEWLSQQIVSYSTGPFLNTLHKVTNARQRVRKSAPSIARRQWTGNQLTEFANSYFWGVCRQLVAG